MDSMTAPNLDSGSMRAPILLVDDTPANLLGLQAVLAASDYELVSVASGPEALAQLETREFAVVQLDLQMPVMDGVETALEIRRRGSAHGHVVPIIFVTATDASVPRVLTAYASGAVDFIQKPLQPEILRSKVFVFAELHRAKQRLVVEIEQRRRLQDALRARDELLAIVSHDLRNPLNAVLLGAHQIESAAEDREWARARKAAGGIAKAVERMSRLVGDLLDLATLDAGKPLAMNVGQHDLAELVLEISELLEPLAQSKQVTLETDVPTAIRVLCDRDRVQQVLSDLISNSIEFTRSRAGINVAARGRRGGRRLGARHRGGHPGEARSPCLRCVLEGRFRAKERCRPGPVDRQGHRRSARRAHLGRDRGRTRKQVLLHPARSRRQGSLPRLGLSVADHGCPPDGTVDGRPSTSRRTCSMMSVTGTGFLRNASHPAASASMRSASEARALTARIATFRRCPTERSARATANPLTTGSIRSSTTTSGAKRGTCSSASSPFAA